MPGLVPRTWFHAFVPALAAAASEASGPADLLFVIVPVAVVVGSIYVGEARSRARSRREHADFATSGEGTWEGVIAQTDLSIFFPQVHIGLLRLMFLSEGIRVALTLDSFGLRLRPQGLLMRRYAEQHWSVPWREVLSAQSRPAGFKTLGGKISMVRLTDVVITTVGNSARPFLEWWELVDDEGDESLYSPEELAEDESWLAYAREEIGPSWQPGTAQIRIRMSAPDGLLPAVDRWARGTQPEERASGEPPGA